MKCNHPHRYNEKFLLLPGHQGGEGRHKCAGCAYELGYKMGLKREGEIILDLNSLPDSQAGTIRHKCPHLAFAMGYEDGLRESLTKRTTFSKVLLKKVMNNNIVS